MTNEVIPGQVWRHKTLKYWRVVIVKIEHGVPDDVYFMTRYAEMEKVHLIDFVEKYERIDGRSLSTLAPFLKEVEELKNET